MKKLKFKDLKKLAHRNNCQQVAQSVFQPRPVGLQSYYPFLLWSSLHFKKHKNSKGAPFFSNDFTESNEFDKLMFIE